MFDSYFVNRDPNVRVTATIAEERAPTDDSIRLLKEMREKVEKDFLEALKLSFIGIEVTFVESDHRGLNFYFNINGENHKITLNRHIIDKFNRRGNRPWEYYHEVEQHFIKEFSKVIFKDFVYDNLKGEY